MRKPLIAGNWKLNKTPNETITLLEELKPLVADVDEVEILVCPPFTSLNVATFLTKETNIKVGAQNMFWEKSGAFTGEISGEMIKEFGCEYVILGHSERRQCFGETDATINKRMMAAFAANLIPIVCVGETLSEREAGKVEPVVTTQLTNSLKGVNAKSHSHIVIAYEPVWAIGTGKTATPEQANEVHTLIRKTLAKIFDQKTADGIRILYGGSVKPDNMKSLMSQSDIDGGLVGGAALDAKSFAKIVKYNG
jgi:triosephosphate isomerase